MLWISKNFINLVLEIFQSTFLQLESFFISPSPIFFGREGVILPPHHHLHYCLNATDLEDREKQEFFRTNGRNSCEKQCANESVKLIHFHSL